MNVLFVLASVVAILSALIAITRTNIIHSLLYLIVSLLAIALDFALLGAPFVAALEVIIYAGAILVLFVFAVMVLNTPAQENRQFRELEKPGVWVGPVVLTVILGVEFLFAFTGYSGQPLINPGISPQQVGITLFGSYLLGVEMVSMLLLAALVGAYHLGRRYSTKNGKGEDL